MQLTDCFIILHLMQTHFSFLFFAAWAALDLERGPTLRPFIVFRVERATPPFPSSWITERVGIVAETLSFRLTREFRDAGRHAYDRDRGPSIFRGSSLTRTGQYSGKNPAVGGKDEARSD